MSNLELHLEESDVSRILDSDNYTRKLRQIEQFKNWVVINMFNPQEKIDD